MKETDPLVHPNNDRLSFCVHPLRVSFSLVIVLFPFSLVRGETIVSLFIIFLLLIDYFPSPDLAPPSVTIIPRHPYSAELFPGFIAFNCRHIYIFMLPHSPSQIFHRIFYIHL